MMIDKNITPVAHAIRPYRRALCHARHASRAGQGVVIWFTGLSGAGKSTLAMALEAEFIRHGQGCYVLDGDNLRHGLNSDLGFLREDRAENVRRVGEVAALFADAGLICIVSLISPYRRDREQARRAFPASFHEIYLSTDLAFCEQRDPKGLYAKARAGKLAHFTGIGSPYEAPESPDLILDTSDVSVETCIQQIIAHIFSE